MTEIVFRSGGTIQTAISTNGRDPDRIRALASEALYGGDVFETFGSMGDAITVEASKGGIIGLSGGGLLVRLCAGGGSALDDSTVTERVTVYRAASMDALEALMEAAERGQAHLHRMVLEDLGIREAPGPAEERTEYWVTLAGSTVLLQEQFITEAARGRRQP